jgi:Zn finger protein HypA/HybF involved in hydrogenase expression
MSYKTKEEIIQYLKNYYNFHYDINNNDLTKIFINKLNLEYKCNICGISEWCNTIIPLQLNYINSIHFNNKIENLILFCPNCNSQTNTFKTKNKKKY